MRQQSAELTGKLRDRLTVLEASARNSSPSGSSSGTYSTTGVAVDSCTGLPMRAAAEASIKRALESGSQSYVGVFYLHRMQLTNARFGEVIGDQVILSCSQHIATTVIRSEDQLFRWSGPAFVAILERVEASTTVNTEVQRMISTPLSRFFETASRSVYLPIKMTGEVFPLEDKTYPEVEEQVQEFLLRAFGVGNSD